MVEAKEEMTVPHSKPKIAPAARVRIAAPGRDRPVMMIYRKKKETTDVNGSRS